MVSSLSALFRIALNSSERGVATLRTEIEHIRHYIDIQKIRYQERISFILEIEPGLEDIPVLPLILQPLIENAVSHGLEPVGGGTVLVRIYREENILIYMICDDGCGANENYIRSFIEKTEKPEGLNFKGFALKNIHDRIRLNFGKEYGLSYTAPEKGGSIFTVRQLISEQQQEDYSETVYSR
jgi:two-component system sensor histidine kinase YesM